MGTLTAHVQRRLRELIQAYALACENVARGECPSGPTTPAKLDKLREARAGAARAVVQYIASL
jgi:hypothetical protein